MVTGKLFRNSIVSFKKIYSKAISQKIMDVKNKIVKVEGKRAVWLDVLKLILN